MSQPVWITEPGSIGVIPEGLFFQTPIRAYNPGDPFTANTQSGSAQLTNVQITRWDWVEPGQTKISGPGITGEAKVVSFNQSLKTITIDQLVTVTAASSQLTVIQNMYYEMVAGVLPPGIQCTKTGLIEGVPKAVASFQGVPLDVARNVTSTFTVRVYTERYLDNGTPVIDRINERTFSITITGQDAPTFTTPSGLVGTYYDGSEVEIQIGFTDRDPGDIVSVSLFAGVLPPGLTITNKGLISGAILPLVGPPGTAQPGYDSTPKDQWPHDFTTRATSQNFQFTLEVTDGKDSNIRTYEIFVYAKNSMTADTVDFTADNTFITADVLPTRTPVLLTPSGTLGRVRADNSFFYKFDALDFDGDAVEFIATVGAGVGYDGSLFDQTGIGFDRAALSLPPGLQIDSDTGWLYGYIPDQGATETTYEFALQVRKRDYPLIISDFVYYTMTIVGNIDTEVIWLTDPDLGTIDNGAVSTFFVEAENVGGRALEYRLVSGSDSQLPQGLSLLPSGHIVGRVSFNTFALDGGTTVFDTTRELRITPNPTTFDLEYEFDVNAYAPVTDQLGYRVSRIVILDGGSGYDPEDPPTVVIEAPPAVAGAVQATAGIVSIEDGAITSIAVGNPGQGYSSTPLILIEGNAVAIAQIEENTITNAVSVVRRFSILINRAFNQPYESLYIQCMPPENDRTQINEFLQNQRIIPQDVIYRADDPNFGLAQGVNYVHAYGLSASALIDYVNAMQINHYWRNVTLGDVRTARALDSSGNVLYEVVYSPVIDDLVNNQGESVSKRVELPYPVQTETGTITYVYPNSLINMRDQIISQVGQISPALPLWMRSKQSDGRILGFVPCWVIAYVKPGEADRVAYYIRTRSSLSLNTIDFKLDRYELDRSQTYNWDPATDHWIPSPPEATTFDQGRCVFDGGSTTFIAPADFWVSDDRYNKYLLFPKQTILG